MASWEHQPVREYGTASVSYRSMHPTRECVYNTAVHGVLLTYCSKLSDEYIKHFATIIAKSAAERPDNTEQERTL